MAARKTKMGHTERAERSCRKRDETAIRDDLSWLGEELSAQAAPLPGAVMVS
ncbi:hypothetical protein [Salipiger abyssi]|uniref:hypothetical protein n=1 Tax=Salipiger abyssi TaxID=1250539 RepID=UPI00405949F7